MINFGISNTIIDALKVDYWTLKVTHLKEDSYSKIFIVVDDYSLETSRIVDGKNYLAIKFMTADIIDSYKADYLKCLSIRKIFLINEKYARNLIRLKASMEKRKKKC